MRWTSGNLRQMRAAGAMTRISLGVVSLGAMLTGCSVSRQDRHALPTAEFLFSAGDSTYWVQSGGEGMRVRSAPILLTSVDGRLFEIFTSGEGAEYDDASFSTVRLWARVLQNKDSILLFSDSTVMRELRSWRRRHPRESEIDPADQELIDDPLTVVQDDIDIIDVHGPYLTFEHLLNVEMEGGQWHVHEGRRYVLDVRSGRLMSLAELLGDAAAARIMTTARESLAHLIDSIRMIGNSGDQRALDAIETLDSFAFDPTSFGITDLHRDPAVAFMVPGHDSDGSALALSLPPVAVKEPVWWGQVRLTLPEWNADSTVVRWDRGQYVVSARPTAGGDVLALVLSARMGAGTQREWPVATVVSPAYQLIALESPPLDSITRAALARAFDISTALDGMVPRALLHRGAPGRLFRYSSWRWQQASLPTSTSSPPHD